MQLPRFPISSAGTDERDIVGSSLSIVNMKETHLTLVEKQRGGL